MAKSATTWGVGDYPRMAAVLEPVSVAAVASVPLTPGVRVLDVASGTGNASLLSATKGAIVTGVDIEPRLIEMAEGRAVAAGVDVHWLVGDCERLPVPEASADVVFSIFGVMYASDHLAAARELDRVTSNGGRVVLASWQPGSFMPAMGSVLGSFLPRPAPATGPPSRWGDIDSLRDILRPTNLRLESTSTGRVSLVFPNASDGASFLIETAGHVVAEQDRLMATGTWATLRHELTKFILERCEWSDGSIALGLDYLLATARKE
jgi:SAM-dependent methyltransferase